MFETVTKPACQRSGRSRQDRKSPRLATGGFPSSGLMRDFRPEEGPASLYQKDRAGRMRRYTPGDPGA